MKSITCVHCKEIIYQKVKGVSYYISELKYYIIRDEEILCCECAEKRINAFFMELMEKDKRICSIICDECDKGIYETTQEGQYLSKVEYIIINDKEIECNKCFKKRNSRYYR
jgi:hypothetical protein